jgi:hypothetical protein
MLGNRERIMAQLIDIWVERTPDFAELRDQPSFQALLARMSSPRVA